MSGRIGPHTAADVLKALQHAGFYVDHASGSHYILRHPDGRGPVVLPVHAGDIKSGTLQSLLRQARISHQDFLGMH